MKSKWKTLLLVFAFVCLLGLIDAKEAKAASPYLIKINKQQCVVTIYKKMCIRDRIYMGCLRGAGDVLFTTFASTLSVTIIRPLSSYLFCYVFGMGVIGIWVGVTCDQICRYILTFYRFRTGKWMRIKI